uniref:Ovule protein n=1 Tax=Anisakis simplex TaxID=6269 RepID=A0A0M3J451_ANISI
LDELFDHDRFQKFQATSAYCRSSAEASSGSIKLSECLVIEAEFKFGAGCRLKFQSFLGLQLMIRSSRMLCHVIPFLFSLKLSYVLTVKFELLNSIDYKSAGLSNRFCGELSESLRFLESSVCLEFKFSAIVGSERFKDDGNEIG